MSNEATSTFKNENQLKVRKPEQIVDLISTDFGVETLPNEVLNDKKKLVEIYLKLVDNGGDDSFIFDINDKDLESAPIKAKTKETLGQKRKRLKKELFVLWKVTIHDNDPTEKPENEEHKRVRFVSWGNDLIGHYTTRVVFDEPMFVHEGCLRNLRQAQYRKTYTQKGEAGIKYGPFQDRFSIQYHEDVDQDFIDNLAKKQQLLDMTK